MPTEILYFRNWEFETDVELTKSTYKNISIGVLTVVSAMNVKTMLLIGTKCFPGEIRKLFRYIRNWL